MKQFILSLLFAIVLCHPVVASPLSVKSQVRGDVNADGLVNISDVTFIMSIIQGQADTEYSFDTVDVNNDGLININDVSIVISIILGNSGDSGDTPPVNDDDTSFSISFSRNPPPAEAD